jgi:serine/threonine protein kinase
MKKSKLDAFEEDSEQILRELERNYLEVLTTLGYGTFGRVKLVKFRGKDEVYALKIMRKQEILEQNQLMHLHSEKEVLLEINHPNIVALYSIFHAESRHSRTPNIST